MNGLTSKAFEQPENLNAIYLLANQCLKTSAKTHLTEFATTATTTLDQQEETNQNNHKKNQKD